MTEEKQALLRDIVNDLIAIRNVTAVVLGGSHAVGMANEDSDLDIGIYYSQESPFSIEEVRRVAEKYSVAEKPTVTGYYEWGPWVNGGAWISTAEGDVDFLYKNIDQIRKTIADAGNGIWENSYDQQPPYGFSSIIYMAETENCRILHDPESVVLGLKESIRPYPDKLRQSVIQQSLWSAEFTIWQAGKFASKSDIYCTMGCITRAMHAIVSALFAINEIYPMGDKRAIEILSNAGTKPVHFKERVEKILCIEGKKPVENVSDLKILFDEVVSLAGGRYTPYYVL